MKNLTTLLFILLFAHASAQSIFDETKNRQQTFRYSNSNPPALNNILKELTDGNNRALLSVEYTIEYRQRITLMRSAGKVNIILSSDQFNTLGPVLYRGIEIDEWLIPVSMNVILIRTNNSGGRPIPFEHHFNNIRIQNRSAERSEESFIDTSLTPWTIQVKDISFNFSSQQYKALKDFTDRIKNYYETTARIKSDNRLASTINPVDFENFELQDSRLQSLEKNLTGYESQNYSPLLNLNNQDPAGYLNQINLLKKQVKNLRKDMNQTFIMLPQLFYDKAIWFSNTGNKNMSRLYFGRALTFNPMFAPAAFQLALLDFRTGNDCDAEMHVRQVLTLMTPDPVTYDYAINLARDIYHGYVDKAGRNIKANKLAEANENLRLAEALCNDIHEVKCTDELDERYKVVRNGMYANLLAEAASAYRNNELEKAERQLKEAKRLREKFSNQVSPSETESSIGNAIIQKRYDDLITKASNLILTGKYAEALDNLEYSDDIMLEFPTVKPAENVLALKQSASKPVIGSVLESAFNLANNNQLAEARAKAAEAGKMISAYSLSDDTEITAALTKLKEKIFSQECTNAQNEFNIWYKKGNQAATELDFLAAYGFYSKANQVLTDNSDCGLTAFRLADEMTEINDGYTYQKMLASVLKMQEDAQYAASIEQYQEAGEFFKLKNISRYGIRHLSLEEFTETKCRNNFITFMASKAIQDLNTEYALRLYKLVLQRGYQPKDIKNGLNRLGQSLAQRDKPKNPTAKPKKLVEQYTAGDKKLKELRSAYLKKWKTIK
ncbi:MAG: hypothetical protein LC117_08510 [Bacteroidia bacterium]|nr:hypothetical protein [Bacteroidia bacterium]